MITANDLQGLQKDDQLLTVPLFPAVPDDLMTLRVLKVEGKTVTFIVLYLGVTLCQWAATEVKGDILWKM